MKKKNIKFNILPLSQNKCCIPTAQVNMMVNTPAQLGNKTDHLKMNGAAKIQHLFWGRGSIYFKNIHINVANYNKKHAMQLFMSQYKIMKLLNTLAKIG